MPISDFSGNAFESLWIAIKADLTGLQTGLAVASKDLKSFGVRIANSSVELNRMGKTLFIVGGALTVIGALAVKVFANFQQSMANTYSVINATNEEMAKLEKTARKMGETTIFTASQAADAMYYLASAGYNTNQVVGALKGTLELAASTQFDLAETTRTVVSTMNAFGLEAKDASRVANTFAAAISSSQATMDRLSESMKYVAPIASVLGISLEQTTAALSLLYNSGLSASQAGTSLRQSLLRLQKVTPGGVKALRDMGLTVKDVSPQFHDLVGIINNFRKAGAQTIDKADELSRIFDARAVGTWQILIKAGGYALKDLQEKITGTEKASQMAHIQIDTIIGSFKLLLSTVQETAIQFGKTLAPTIRNFVSVIRNLFLAFNNLNSGVKSTISIISSMTVVTALLTGALLWLLSKLPAIVEGVRTLELAFSLSLGKVLLVIAALGLLATAIYEVTTSSIRQRKEMEDSLSAMGRENGKRIENARLIKSQADEYLNLANKSKFSTEKQKRLSDLYSKLRTTYPSIISGTKNYKDRIKEVGSVSATVSTQLDKLYKLQEKITKLKLTLELFNVRKEAKSLESDLNNLSIVDTIQNKLKGSPEIASKFRQTFIDAFKGTGKEVSDLLNKDLAGNLTTGIKEKFTINLSSLTKSLQNLAKKGNVGAIRESLQSSSDVLRDMNLEIKDLQLKGDELSASDYKRLTDLVSIRNAIQSTSNVYGKVLKTALDLEIAKGRELEIQKQINELGDNKTGGSGKCPKGYYKDPTTGKCMKIQPLTDPELEKKANDLAYQLKKTELESELQLASLYKDRSLKQALAYAEIEHQIRLNEIKKDKNDQITVAKETGSSLTKIQKQYIDRLLVEDKVYAENRKKIGRAWSDEEIKKYSNRLDISMKVDKSELEFYQKMLSQKLKSLEVQDKKYTNEYVQTAQKIKSINEEINKMSINPLKFQMDTGTDIITGKYTKQYATALEQYKNYLEIKIGMEQQWSDKYLELKTELYNTEKQIREYNLQQVENYSKITNDAISAGINQVFNVWIIKSRQAKNEMDSVWLAIRNAALRALQDIVTSEITKAVTKLILKIASFLSGSIPGTVATGVDIVNPTDYSGYGASGAIIRKSGTLNVHAGEIVVPASIVKKHRSNYDNAVSGDNQKTTNNNINVNLTLNNPVVDDNSFWENITNKHIKPAIKTINKRYGE